MSQRVALPSRHNHITQKVCTANQRTLYISLHDDPSRSEFFLRVKGAECTPEIIGLHDVIARLMSVALQYSASVEKLGDLPTGAQIAPCGPVSGHDRLKHCSSVPDLIGRHLLVGYCGRGDLAHVLSVSAEPP